MDAVLVPPAASGTGDAAVPSTLRADCAPTVQPSRDARADDAGGLVADTRHSPRDGPREPAAEVVAQATPEPVSPVPPPVPAPVPPVPVPAPAVPVGPTGPTGHGGSSTTVSSGGGQGHDHHVLVAGLTGDALGGSAAPGSTRYGFGPDRSPAGTAENPGARPD